MRAFCEECGKQMEPGFTTIVTPYDYQCDEDGGITDFDQEKLRTDWVDGITFYGWWCHECGEWYNETSDIREEDETEETEDPNSWEILDGILGDDNE